MASVTETGGVAIEGHEQEVASGERFSFGENWTAFLRTLDDERVAQAESSLLEMLGVEDLSGRSFLDAGSGSGLFSLAANRLGARVQSFDYDPASVACTRELRSRFGRDEADWTITEGSVLDPGFLSGLGTFDVVYSWGVLHHTGDLWAALENVVTNVAPGGRLFIALYNDQGRRSRGWLGVKRVYCRGLLGRSAVLGTFVPAFVLRDLLRDVLVWRDPLARYREYRKKRGMSRTHDWVDWLGGLPFEVARPDDVVAFGCERGLFLEKLVTVGGGSGNNQFVLRARE